MNDECLKKSRKLFFIALGVDIAVTALVAISAFWAIGALKDVQAGRREVSQSFIGTLEFWENFSKLTIVTLICVGLALVKWLNSCYRFAKDSIGATGFKNEGWTAAGWIVPFLNLFKPYQVISEIHKAGAPSYKAPDDWQKESSSGLLLTWWIFWAISHFIMWVVGKEMLRKSFKNDLTLPQIIGLYDIQAWVCIISLIVAGLWFAVANHLTQRLISRSSLNAAATPASAESLVVTRAGQATPLLVEASGESPIPSTAPSDIPVSPSSDEVVFESAAANEDAIYAAIAVELETGKTDRGLWTKLFAECDGDEKRTKVAYIKHRAERLIAAGQRT